MPPGLELSGKGNWDCSPYLDELLFVPFLEPEVLAHPGTPPDVMFQEKMEEKLNVSPVCGTEVDC